MATAVLCAAGLLAAQGCHRENPAMAIHDAQPYWTATTTQTAYRATVPIEDWPGHWTGPEGTSLTLTPTAAGYEVRIRNLDGEQVYSGVRVKDHIEFQRDKKLASIWSGNGGDTGMKWLVDRQRCLIVATGEGYCRD